MRPYFRVAILEKLVQTRNAPEKVAQQLQRLPAGKHLRFTQDYLDEVLKINPEIPTSRIIVEIA